MRPKRCATSNCLSQGVETYRAKIGEANAASLALFQQRLGFVEVSRSSVFQVRIFSCCPYDVCRIVRAGKLCRGTCQVVVRVVGRNLCSCFCRRSVSRRHSTVQRRMRCWQQTLNGGGVITTRQTPDTKTFHRTTVLLGNRTGFLMRFDSSAIQLNCEAAIQHCFGLLRPGVIEITNTAQNRTKTPQRTSLAAAGATAAAKTMLALPTPAAQQQAFDLSQALSAFSPLGSCTNEEPHSLVFHTTEVQGDHRWQFSHLCIVAIPAHSVMAFHHLTNPTWSSMTPNSAGGTARRKSELGVSAYAFSGSTAFATKLGAAVSVAQAKTTHSSCARRTCCGLSPCNSKQSPRQCSTSLGTAWESDAASCNKL